MTVNAVVAEWCLIAPWWSLLIILLSLRNITKHRLKYSSKMFSRHIQLFMGRKLSSSEVGLLGFESGSILDILKMSGNVLVIIMELIKCVTCDSRMWLILNILNIWLFNISCSVLFEFLRFSMIFLVFSIVISGIWKVFWFLGLKNLKIWIWLANEFVNVFPIFTFF